MFVIGVVIIEGQVQFVVDIIGEVGEDGLGFCFDLIKGLCIEVCQKIVQQNIEDCQGVGVEIVEVYYVVKVIIGIDQLEFFGELFVFVDCWNVQVFIWQIVEIDWCY